MDERKNIIWISLALFTVVGFLFFFLRSESSRTDAKNHSTLSSIKLEANQGSGAPINVKKEKPEKTDPCDSFFKKIQEHDIRVFVAETGGLHNDLNGNRCKLIPSRFTNVHQRYLQICGRYSDLEKQKAGRTLLNNARRDCGLVLALYRAYVTDWRTQNTPLDQISDPQVLVEKSIAQYAENPGASADAADRSLALHPNEGARKLSALGRFFDARLHASEPGNEKYWEKAEKAIDAARGQGVRDERLFRELEIGIEISRGGDPDKVREKAEWMVTHYPDHPEGYYYFAWSESDRGNLASAIEHFQTAQRLDPSDPRYALAIQAFSQSKPGLSPQVMQINIPLPMEILNPDLAE